MPWGPQSCGHSQCDTMAVRYPAALPTLSGGSAVALRLGVQLPPQAFFFLLGQDPMPYVAQAHACHPLASASQNAGTTGRNATPSALRPFKLRLPFQERSLSSTLLHHAGHSLLWVLPGGKRAQPTQDPLFCENCHWAELRQLSVFFTFPKSHMCKHEGAGPKPGAYSSCPTRVRPWALYPAPYKKLKP